MSNRKRQANSRKELCREAIHRIDRTLARSDEREKLMERFRVQNDLAMQDLRRRLLSY